MLALPHDLKSTWKLANDGIHVPGPIQFYYDWPGKYEPFAKQKMTADFFTQNSRAFCFNEIGTGKTMSALWAVDYMRRETERPRRVLILATLSTLERVWADEIWHNFPTYTYGVLYGARGQRERVMQNDYDFYIMNHDGIKVFIDIDRDGRYRRIILDPIFDEFLRGIDLVIVDEGAVFRNSQTDLWLALREIAKNKDIWWLTGSPMPHAPTDIWAQAKIVAPTLVPRFFGRFRDQVMYKKTQFKWLPKPGWERTVYSMVRPVVRFRRDEFVDLPPRLPPQSRESPLSLKQTRLAKALLREFAVELEEGRLTIANEGVRRQKLLQVYSGAVYLDGGVTKVLDPAMRLSDLNRVIEESGSKVIVFAPFSHNIRFIHNFLSDQYSVGVITGETSPNKRNKIFREFQEGNLQILLANPGTMAHGLTLTASHTIVWWTPIDDFEIYEQANGRITRPGQKHTQLIVHLQGSKLEAEVYRRLAKKESLQGLLLALLEQLSAGGKSKSEVR